MSSGGEEHSEISSEDGNDTIGTASNMSSSEDENGKYITEDSDLQLFHLLKSIRNDDSKLYDTKENWFSESHPDLSQDIDKEELVNDYFASLISEETSKKKSKKKKPKKKVNTIADEKLTDSDLFLKNFLLSKAWKIGKKDIPNYEQIQEEELKQLEFENSNNIDMSEGEKSKEKKIKKQPIESSSEEEEEEEEETVAKYRFEEEGGIEITKYPRFTEKEGSVREKKMSKKKKERLRRNENYKIKLNKENEEFERKRTKIKKQIIELVSDLRKLQNSETLQNLNLEDENIFDKIEHHKIYDELVTISLEDEDEEDKQEIKLIKEIKRNIRRKFEEYYETFYESAEGDLKFKFKYNTVEKDNFGLDVTDILQIEDELLEETIPTHSIRIQDTVGKKLDPEVLAKKINKLKSLPAEKIKNKLSKTPVEKKKKMKRLTRVKKREILEDE
eukprot:gene4708-8292_t